jgi:ABC-2 type transport system permease protein
VTAFAQLHGAAAIIKRDALIYLSYRSSFAGQLFGALFSLTLFYYISRLVRVGAFDSADAYFAFVMVGLVIVQVLQSTLALCSSIRGELLAGTFERIVVSPFGAIAAIAAMTVFPLAQALILGIVTLAAGGLVFDVAITWDTAAAAVPVAILGSFSFTAIGLFFVAIVILFKQTAAGIGFVTAGIALISGLYVPIAVLPEWIQWFANVQPFTPAVDLLRHFLVGLPLTEPVPTAVLKLVAFAVILLPLSVYAVSRAIRRARRTGTIIEY